MIVRDLIGKGTFRLMNHFLFIDIVQEQSFGGNQVNFGFGVEMDEGDCGSLE